MPTGEQLVSPIQFTSNVKSDHPDTAEATSVTVMVSVTCSGEAYNVQESQAVARTLSMNAARTMLGDGYALVGEVALGMPQTQTVDSQETAELAIKTDGVWMFQFSPTQRETIAQEIAGKPQRDAFGANSLSRQTDCGGFTVRT